MKLTYPKWILVVAKLHEMDGWNKVFQLSKDVGISWPHHYNVVKTIQDANLVESRIEGKVKSIKLTEAGKPVAKLAYELIQAHKKTEDEHPDKERKPRHEE